MAAELAYAFEAYKNNDLSKINQVKIKAREAKLKLLELAKSFTEIPRTTNKKDAYATK